MKSFLYGLMYLQHQNASIEIGPLICKEPSNIAANLRNISGKSCQSWKDLGFPSGYYLVENQYKSEEGVSKYG